MKRHDAVVIGAGPNGLAAAIVLAQAGLSTAIHEATESIGGGCRTAEVTLPGFRHDVCSAIHPLAVASPFFSTLPLEQYGLHWIQPPIALAHPFDDGSAALLVHSIDETAQSLGEDRASYQRLMRPLVEDYELLVPQLLGPVRLPRHPFALATFGMLALRSAQGIANARFQGVHARGLFAGLAAHSFLRLDQRATSAFALMLGLLAHAVGWPIARGGSQSIVEALASHLRSLGGEIELRSPISSLEAFDPDQLVLLDLTPRQVTAVSSDRLPKRYRRRLGRYRYGPGVFKIDWALDGPVPWTSDACRDAGTVHLGGTIEEIAAAEREVSLGRHPDRPLVLVGQQSRFDPTRAPAEKATLWGYCHVPNGSREDMTNRIERQIERFAPGFRERILARSAMGPADLELYNANYVGGDINGGLQDLRQMFTRPVPRLNPYSTPDPNIFVCSASTPPGGGVHGMAGYFAARAALKKCT